jgi:toxin ParE1/3/4
MIRRIATTRVADRDISDVAAHIAIDNPEAAGLFTEELWRTLERLKANPESGVAVTGASAPLRFVRVSRRFRRYLIFYRRIDEESLEVIRILHGARDLTTLLSGI